MLLYNPHIGLKNRELFVFYISYHMDRDQFNQLYNLNLIKKRVKNSDAIAHKLGSALTKAINLKLQIIRKEMWKK